MHQLPKLPYDYRSLEPVIDAKTMEIHHTKHHGGYVDKLNAALEGHHDLLTMSVENLLANLDQVPAEIQLAVRNNGGGHANHSLFWTSLQGNGQQEPSEKLMSAFKQFFGGFDNFKNEFTQHALNRFGSGWAWLVANPDNQLLVLSTPNQDSPIMDGLKPILGLDVWEHAYYLQYQNRRPEYVENWWQIVNWAEVEKRLE